MKKLLLLMILSFSFSAYAVLPIIEEKLIKVKIESANYCTETSDCIIANFGCPFGCTSYVNKHEAEAIYQSIKNADLNKCEYKCARQTQVVCVQGKCQRPPEFNARPSNQ